MLILKTQGSLETGGRVPPNKISECPISMANTKNWGQTLAYWDELCETSWKSPYTKGQDMVIYPICTLT